LLISLISKEAEGSRRKIIVAAVVSGIANASVLGIVNEAALKSQNRSARLFFMFLLACAIYGLGYRACVSMVSSTFETALYRVRVGVADRLRRAELAGLEHIGTSEIYERLTHETSIISQASWALAGCLQSAVMATILSLSLLFLSPIAFVITVAMYGAGGYLYHQRRKQTDSFMRKTAAAQTELMDRLNDLLRGFKELRFRAGRGDALVGDYRVVADAVRTNTVKTNTFNEANYVFLYLNLFAILAALVFVLPQYDQSTATGLSQLVALCLFMFGSVGNVLFALPQYGRANLAAESIYDLEHKLTAVAGPEVTQEPWAEPFRELRAVNIEYRYEGGSGIRERFSIGPMSLTIRAGEIVFIVGGNGSGKSTLVKVLTALYTPTAGDIYVNGHRVGPHNIQAYREMLAAVFTDFHLFKKLYGLSAVPSDAVRALLERMQIGHKTEITDQGFTTLDLSTGQRKRLAMVVALLEDRPVYVFDEWAADQDPEFRHYYYEELLPTLKREGKTTIAISHDDRYFHCADQVIKLDYGQIDPAGSVRAHPSREA
jgi:putative ATP-binding cassette transporter